MSLKRNQQILEKLAGHLPTFEYMSKLNIREKTNLLKHTSREWSIKKQFESFPANCYFPYTNTFIIIKVKREDGKMRRRTWFISFDHLWRIFFFVSKQVVFALVLSNLSANGIYYGLAHCVSCCFLFSSYTWCNAEL